MPPTPEPPSPGDPEVLRLAVALHQLGRSLQRTGPGGAGLPPLPLTELEVARHVAHRPGETVGQVAAALSLQPSNVSTAVRGLVERGLLRRGPDPRDRRVVRLHPTPRAVEHRGLVERAWADALGAALAGLPPQEARALLEATTALELVNRAVLGC